MAKERPPALLVMALGSDSAMYVAVVVKSNHLHPPLPSLQAEERGERWKGSGVVAIRSPENLV